MFSFNQSGNFSPKAGIRSLLKQNKFMDTNWFGSVSKAGVPSNGSQTTLLPLA